MENALRTSNRPVRFRGRAKNVVRIVPNAYNRLVAYFAYKQESEKWREWTYRLISQRQAQALVASGEAGAISRKHNGTVQIVGFRALKPLACEVPSPTSLTVRTTAAVGNAVGKPADLRLSRRERDEITKFLVWPLIGDRKAVSVCPKQTGAERKRAESILRTGDTGVRLNLSAQAA